MATLEIELADMNGVQGAVQPTIAFEFRVRKATLGSLGNRATPFDISLRGTMSAGTHAGLELPVFDIRPRTEYERLDHLDRIDATLSLSHNALERIEEMRRDYGEDLELAVDIEIVAQGHNDDNITRDRDSATVRIDSYQWTEVLETLGFYEQRVVELNFTGDPESVAALETAHAEVERAQRRNDAGDYKGAIQCCRDAVESLEHVDKDHLAAAFDNTKLEAMEKQLGVFRKQYLGKFSHAEDKIGIDPALPRDSDFAISLTKSFIQYYAKALEDLPETGYMVADDQ